MSDSSTHQSNHNSKHIKTINHPKSNQLSLFQINHKQKRTNSTHLRLLHLKLHSILKHSSRWIWTRTLILLAISQINNNNLSTKCLSTIIKTHLLTTLIICFNTHKDKDKTCFSHKITIKVVSTQTSTISLKWTHKGNLWISSRLMHHPVSN